jgi:hypothetical protein
VNHLASITRRVFPLCSCALALFAGSSTVCAQQFVLVDSTYTATTQNTKDSQYPIAPLPAAPASWKTPVDYAGGGSIYVRFEVLERPSTLSTLANVCFETASTLTCEPYPPPFTNKGVFTASGKINLFWQYSVFDWTKKLDRVYVVLKDANENLVQGNSQYYPTKMHVTVTVVPPGKSYVPPKSNDGDAGVSDSPAMTMKPDASTKDAAVAPARAGTAALSAGRAGATPARAGTGVPGNAAPTGTAGARATSADAGPQYGVRDYIDPGSNCAAVGPRPRPRPHARARSAWDGAWFVLGVALLLQVRVRARRPRS